MTRVVVATEMEMEMACLGDAAADDAYREKGGFVVSACRRVLLMGRVVSYSVAFRVICEMSGSRFARWSSSVVGEVQEGFAHIQILKFFFVSPPDFLSLHSLTASNRRSSTAIRSSLSS